MTQNSHQGRTVHLVSGTIQQSKSTFQTGTAQLATNTHPIKLRPAGVVLTAGLSLTARVIVGLVLLAVLGGYLYLVVSKPETAAEAMAAGDYGGAAKLYESAIEQGDRRAANSLGNLYYLGLGVNKDYKVAGQLYLKSAAAGIAEAQINIGHLFKQGLGVGVDPVRAFAWYNMADIHGNPIAEYYMRQIVQEQTVTGMQIKSAQTKWGKLPNLVDAGLQ